MVEKKTFRCDSYRNHLEAYVASIITKTGNYIDMFASEKICK